MFSVCPKECRGFIDGLRLESTYFCVKPELFELYFSAMSQATTTVPLSTDEAGVLRVAGTRVSLDSVIYAFSEGATPEEIVQAFPTLDLAAIYSVIGYYL